MLLLLTMTSDAMGIASCTRLIWGSSDVKPCATTVSFVCYKSYTNFIAFLECR